MQRIHPTALSPEQYIETEAHRQVRGEGLCPRCGKGRLQRHGFYSRGVTGVAGQELRVLVARFICAACRGTVSYLPGFALSYRLVQVSTFEAFLEGEFWRREVQRWLSVLEDYRRRMLGYATELWRRVGCGLGRAPPASSRAMWPWLKAACGGLTSAARRLVAEFRTTLFRQYQCHQPAGVW
ncbi:MAG: hypothetical protein HS122_05730 [Opitutaceae bacterium]|nr:hypothetical protein [Opitutaceae bacterium]